MSYSAAGIIYFSKKCDIAVQNSIAIHIVNEAAKRQFGVSLGASIPSWTREKFEQLWQINLKETDMLMPFNVTDSFLSCNCQKLFEPISIHNINEVDRRRGDVSKSMFPVLQSFFADVFTLEEISRIRFDWELAYDMPENFKRIRCHPKQLCDVVEKQIELTGSFEPSISVEFAK